MQPSGPLIYWAGMTSRARKSATEFRETADQFRRLAQFVSGGPADALIEGATALDAKAARLERRLAPLLRLKRRATRG
jgi:hypothetical protein